jgi:hypothetical protein
MAVLSVWCSKRRAVEIKRSTLCVFQRTQTRNTFYIEVVVIRWYDYIVAILAADFILVFVLAGIYSTTWWGPMLNGVLAGLVWQIWKNDYCNFRLKQEKRRERF